MILITIIIMALTVVGIFYINQCFMLLGYGFAVGAVVLSIAGIVQSILYCIELVKEKQIVESIIIIASYFLVGIFCTEKIIVFRYTYSVLGSKLFLMTVISVIVCFRRHRSNISVSIDKTKIALGFSIIIIAVGTYYLMTTYKMNSLVFAKIPDDVKEFFVQQEIKSECVDFTIREELAIIINKIKTDYPDVNEAKAQFTAEGINKVIGELGYKPYNGIYCYAVEDDDPDAFLIGMVYGEISSFFTQGKNYNQVDNVYVDKNTFEILDRVYQESEN